MSANRPLSIVLSSPQQDDKW